MEIPNFPSIGTRKPEWFSPHLCQGIVRWSLFLLFFLVPIFFLPWTSEAFEINKQTVFVLLTGVAFAAWLCSFVREHKLHFRLGLVSLLPALFLLAVFVSSLFSISGYQTWVGQMSQEYTSFLSIALFVVLFFILLNHADDAVVQRRSLAALMLSATLSGLVALAYALGWKFIPGVESLGFNLAGGVNANAIFLLVMMHVGLALWLGSHKGAELLGSGRVGVGMRVLIVLVAVLAFLFTLAIDFWFFWFLHILGVLLLVGRSLFGRGVFPSAKRFAVPFLLLLASIIFLFAPSPLRLKLPLVVSPSYGASWSMTNQALTQNTKTLLFGTGPGTFMYDFARFKPEAINQSSLWYLQFDRSKSHTMTLLATLGLIGTALWLVFVVYLLVKSLSGFLRQRNEEGWDAGYAVFVGWVLLFAASLLYSSNFTLSFVFWGLSGLLASRFTVRMLKKDFSEAPRLSLASVFLFVTVGIGVACALFVAGQRYAADVAYASAVRSDRNSPSFQADVNRGLARAIQLNKWSDAPYRAISTSLLGQAGSILANPKGEKGKLNDEQTQQLRVLVVSGVDAASQATTVAPASSLNWAVRGAVYRDLMPYVNGAEDFAVASINKAIDLEPANPAHHVSLGRVYLALVSRATSLMSAEDVDLANGAREARAKHLTSAEQAFARAITLKPDYALAHYYLAGTYERAGRLSDATKRMEALTKVSPMDIGLGFQLGVLYLRQKDLDKAQGEFERVLKLKPDYANAQWYLASVFELKGNKTAAIEQVQKVLDREPANAAVQERLVRMRRGELTTVLPDPVTPPEPQAVNEFEVPADAASGR